MSIHKEAFDIIQDHAHEIKNALEEEYLFIKQGKAEDALLIFGMTHNLSTSEMIKIGRHRGRSWPFLSALADAKLEIEGQGLLHLVQQIVGNNLLEQASLQSAQTINRLAMRQAKDADNPRIYEMYERSMEYAAEQPLLTVEAYWNTIRRKS